MLIPLISEILWKFINVFEALTYLSDKYDKHNLKTHEKISNSDLGAAFEQQTINTKWDRKWTSRTKIYRAKTSSSVFLTKWNSSVKPVMEYKGFTISKGIMYNSSSETQEFLKAGLKDSMDVPRKPFCTNIMHKVHTPPSNCNVQFTSTGRWMRSRTNYFRTNTWVWLINQIKLSLKLSWLFASTVCIMQPNPCWFSFVSDFPRTWRYGLCSRTLNIIVINSSILNRKFLALLPKHYRTFNWYLCNSCSWT